MKLYVKAAPERRSHWLATLLIAITTLLTLASRSATAAGTPWPGGIRQYISQRIDGSQPNCLDSTKVGQTSVMFVYEDTPRLYVTLSFSGGGIEDQTITFTKLNANCEVLDTYTFPSRGCWFDYIYDRESQFILSAAISVRRTDAVAGFSGNWDDFALWNLLPDAEYKANSAIFLKLIKSMQP